MQGGEKGREGKEMKRTGREWHSIICDWSSFPPYLYLIHFDVELRHVTEHLLHHISSLLIGRMKGPKAGEVDYYLAFSFFRYLMCVCGCAVNAAKERMAYSSVMILCRRELSYTARHFNVVIIWWHKE